MAKANSIFDRPQTVGSGGGFIGFQGMEEGNRVLLVANDHYDDVVIDGFKKALEEEGAIVDVYDFHVEGDRELTQTDEIDAIIRREPFQDNPRRYDYGPHEWLLEHVDNAGYDIAMQGFGGPPPDTECDFKALPWLEAEDLVSPATDFPLEVNKLLNELTWEKIYKEGRGGKVHLTDPEGTDIEWTLHPEYMEQGRPSYRETPIYGHLMGHAAPPHLEKEDATGVIAGTTSHFNKPFPHIEVNVEDGVVTDIQGGGKYGDAWRDLLEETQDISYPAFPRDGLFQFWECAIGTNPMVHRPKNTLMLSGGGMERERHRSGVIHCGFGTYWKSDTERWAGARGIPYGHLHVHLLFPTYDIEIGGETIRIIEDGHLTALDNPEVREVAAKYGDPDDILRERWVPDIPGINAPGTYEDYAQEPAAYIEAQL